ncbi:MAG: hypothetical protein AMXMBFR81_23260 [Chthonomonas sp.]
MPWLNIVLWVYALFNIALGVEAYLKVNSMPSLMGGIGAGVLVIVGLLVSQKNSMVGYSICALVALGLLGRFVPAYLSKGTVYPALVVSIASALALVALIVGHFMARKPA